VTDYVVGIRITGDGRIAVQAMDQTAAAGRNMGAALTSASSQASRSLGDTEAAALRVDAALGRSVGTIARWGGALLALRELRDFSNDVVESSSKLAGWTFGLQAATGSAAGAAESLTFIRSEANRLGIELDNSASVFTRLTAATKGTELQGVKTREIFTSVAEAARALHLSGAETGQALLALDQMMSKGTVQAQELKLQLGNVLPGAVHVLAESLGVSTAELDKMMDSGQVLAADALPKLAKKLDEIYGKAASEAAKAPAAEIQRLKNSVLELEAAIGDAGFMGALAGKARALTEALTDLTKSGGLDYLVTGFQAVTALATANVLGDYLSKLGALTAGLTAKAQAQRESILTEQAAASSELELARATQLQTAAEVENAEARLASIRVRLQENEIVNAAAAGEIAAATEVTAAMRSQVTAAMAIVEANAARSASWVEASTTMAAALAADTRSLAQAEATLNSFTAAEIRALEAMRLREAAQEANVALARQEILVQAELTTAKNASTAAAAATEVAEARLASSLKQTSFAMQSLSKVGETLLGLLGGLPGVFLLAAGGLLYLTSRQTEAEKAAGDLADTTERLANAHDMVTEAAIKSARAQLEEQKTILANAKATLDANLSWQRAAGSASAMDAADMQAARAADGLIRLQAAYKSLEDQVTRSVIAKAFQDNLDFLNAGAQQGAASFDQLRESLKKQNATLAEQVATFGKGKAAQVEYARDTAIAAEAAKGDTNETKARIATLQAMYTPLVENAKKLDALTAAQKANTQAKKDAKKETADELKRTNDIAAAYAKLADITDTLSGKNADPVSRAWADSAKSIRDIAEEGGKLIKNGVDESIVQQQVAQAVDVATAARNRAIVAAQREIDVAGQMIKQMQEEAQISLLSERGQAIARAGMEAEQKLREKNLGLSEDQIAIERRRVEAVAATTYDLQHAAEQQRQIIQETNGYLENGLGSFSRAWGDMLSRRTHDWKDFTGNLKSIFQQTISDLIAQTLRLQVFGPLLQQLLGSIGINSGGGSGLLSFLPSYYGSGGNIIGAAGSLGGDGGAAAGGNSYAGYLQNGLQAYRAYNFLTNGSLASLFGGSGSGVTGSLASGYGTAASAAQANVASYGASPSIYGNIGNFAGGTPAYSPLGGTFGIGGYAAPWASAGGGLLGLYYGLQRGSGGLSTVASGLSYGALGAGLAGTASGLLGGASLGSAAGGAFGAAAGMSWIPVAGWTLAALGAIDAVSGGKLFGTKYQAQSSDSYLNIGPNGGDATQFVNEKRQGALFSGAKYRTKQVAASAELQQAADSLYDSVRKSMVQGARQLGVDVPAVINASLQTHYDVKKKTSTYLVDYLGATWQEATADAAAKRIGAEALVATVAASAGNVVQQIAQQFRTSADTLADAAQTMLAAQTDIVKGNSLLALGSSANLAEVIEFTRELQNEGESLAETYSRLQQASQAYVQFVGQFKQTGTGLGSVLQGIAQQMQANIDQANQLAQAAGLQGAREEDLTNIHRYAAEQAADALAKLSTAAQDLATKLYSTTGTTLAAVQAQIDKVQSKLQSATQTALSDLSPLSAKEKLDVALKGLRSGVTNASDVLQLGRQLYASGADYNALYAKVMEISGQPATVGDLTTQLGNYNDLVGKRDQLQGQADAMARFSDAKTLAQYVADISTAHGISYTEAANGLGFKLQDLAKDLGLTNISGYLDSLKQQDIAGTTLTAGNAIVDAIRSLGRDLIQTITGGPLVTPGPAQTTVATVADPAELARLRSIDDNLAAINQGIAKLVTSSDKTAKNTTQNLLRDTANSSRSA